MSEKHIVDLRHVAIASVLNCDYILSWNFKQLVNIRTITRIQAINKLVGYKELNIIPPTMLIEEEDLLNDPIVEYIHKIRLENYENTKNMTLDQIIEQSTIQAHKVIDEINNLKKST